MKSLGLEPHVEDFLVEVAIRARLGVSAADDREAEQLADSAITSVDLDGTPGVKLNTWSVDSAWAERI